MTDRVVHDLPESAYHATKALSAGGAWTLANDCPAVYHYRSPFNPDAAPAENGKPMDIGTALHLAVLEEKRYADAVVLVDAEDWRKQAAREARDNAYAAGLVPLLPKDDNLVGRLRLALLRNPFVARMLDGAGTEISYFWTAEGVPFKARADVVSADGTAMLDLKASASASPAFFQRQAFNAGHFLRSPWYSDGWQIVSGQRAEYWYGIVSREEPHLVSIAKLDERAVEWGRLMIRRAVELFKRCRDRGEWPGYCDGPVTLGLPTWAEFRLAEQEQEGSFDAATINAADVQRATDFLAP